MAVPVTETVDPCGCEEPAAGLEMLTCGPVESVEAVAAASPLCSVTCTPMSADELTVACRIGVLTVLEPRS